MVKMISQRRGKVKSRRLYISWNFLHGICFSSGRDLIKQIKKIVLKSRLVRFNERTHCCDSSMMLMKRDVAFENYVE